MIGSTDTHNSASPVVESDYFGKLGRADGTPVARLGRSEPGARARRCPSNATTYWSAAGLAGIWARENTRAELFDALRRRETFATSGPRIAVRLFAGFDFSPADAAGDLGRVGYAKGVPMGGELTAKAGAGSPVFLVRAQQDPLEAPLERAQIVKVWRRGDETHERVFDVACAGGGAPDPVRHRCPGDARPRRRRIPTPARSPPASAPASSSRAGGIRISRPASVRSTTPGCCRCRPAAGAASMRCARGARARRVSPRRSRSAPLTSPIWIVPDEPTPKEWKPSMSPSRFGILALALASTLLALARVRLEPRARRREARGDRRSPRSERRHAAGGRREPRRVAELRPDRRTSSASAPSTRSTQRTSRTSGSPGRRRRGRPAAWRRRRSSTTA